MIKDIPDKLKMKLKVKTRIMAGSMVPLGPIAPLRSPFAKSVITDNLLGKTIRQFTDSKMSHAVLDKHNTIAWDLDDTLINGKQSWFWRRWIRDNHKGRTFWIITFRNDIDEAIWDDLENCTDPVDRLWFQGIVYIPEILWNTWAKFQPCLREVTSVDQITPAVKKAAQHMNIDYIIQVNRAIRAWKATECKKHNCTVLVEDRERFCKPYCDMLGIQFVNALKD